MKTKALPVNESIPRTPWADVDPEDQLWALNIIREAMDQRFKEVLAQKAYRCFCVAISSGAEFSPEVVWKTLHPRAQDHFNHCREHHEAIDDQIEHLEGLIGVEEALERDEHLEDDLGLEAENVIDEESEFLEEGDGYDG